MKLPIYLFYGPEFGQRNDAVEEIKQKLNKSFGEVENHTFYLMESSINQVINILQSGTLFSNGVCVVCKNAELLKKKEDIQTISKWLENPQENTVLILVSDEGTVDSKLEKLVPQENKKKFWELFESEKLKWVSNFFEQNGYKIESEAVNLILDLVENNTQSLRTECSRFFLCFAKDHLITEEDVDSVLSHTREENPFTLFNSMTQFQESPQKRLEKALEILQKIRLSKENNSVVLIAALASCFRKLTLWQSICVNGYEPSEETCRNNGFSSKIQRRQYNNASHVWSQGQANAILSLLASTDMQIRSGNALLEDVLLQKLLYEIIIKKGAQISELIIQD